MTTRFAQHVAMVLLLICVGCQPSPVSESAAESDLSASPKVSRELPAPTEPLVPDQNSDPQSLTRSNTNPATTADLETKPAIREARTAADFLRHWEQTELESDSSPWLVKLSDEEAQKVVVALRERFPFRSLADRLANVENPVRLERLRQFNQRDSSATTSHVERSTPRQATRTLQALTQLHSEEALRFVQADDFGPSRIIPITPTDLPRTRKGPLALHTEYQSVAEQETGPLVELPLASSAEAETTAKGETPALALGALPARPDLETFNQQAINQFASPGFNGLIRNRDAVAGFQPHHIASLWSEKLGIELTSAAEAAEPNGGWKLNRLELVGLLAHDEFGVYVSDSLPEMEALKGVARRGLDTFEFGGLGRLFRGENVVFEATPNRIRMLGALRATDDCLDCHSVAAGDLLGALSYELLRKPKAHPSSDGK